MDQKFEIGGTIGYDGSYMEFLFRHFKVIRLHAKLHDSAGAVRSHSGKSLGKCYLVGRGPKSCMLAHVTGLLCCLCKKLFLLSTFNTDDFRSSMSCILLGNELADKNVIEELGAFSDGNIQGYSFPLAKKYKTTK